MNALNLARDLESASAESGIPMVAVPQAADIYRISEETSLPIFAQHIDSITPHVFVPIILQPVKLLQV